MNRSLRAPRLPRALLAIAAATAGAAAPVQLAGAATGATAIVTYHGYGFDACTVPTVSQLAALKAGPYRSLAVYVGGPDAGCPARLSKTWVQGATRTAGWSLIPTYVGLQAPGCGCKTISTSTTTAFGEGKQAAASAVSILGAIGIGRGNVVYDDVEGYRRSSTTSPVVLAYVAGWTVGLDEHGYLSGVYSSGSSGITDLVWEVRHNAHRWPLPQDIWIADWNGRATTADKYVPATFWIHHQRLHQYLGPHWVKYGGVSIQIDADYLDGGVVTAASL